MIEVEVFGIQDDTLNQVRELTFVENVSVENQEMKQILTVQTPRGPEAVADLLHILNGTRVGKVNSREPTLEDAYVRLEAAQMRQYPQ